ncbi:MAG: class I SAM-dependent methyltransferase [Sulfuricurvum sp.]|uniref:class I SAM-dependent methyltransferase n=1 Tax=Sulfuricurvum sp. TaxID=2025608 RepID=UPI002733201A|nr:class I SAM-dependent methyltransferase [Sulfuricurvum sp.]MDP3290523.1 class I SAM-dependent methyltransferase [Sulfuricurvum sp.]
MFRKIFSIKLNDSARHEWVKSHLKQIDKGLNLLDAGCGPQKYKTFCSHLNYKSQDFAQYDGIGNGEGLQDKNWEYGKLDYIGNIWEINEKDSFFDAILCTEVLEHIPYPEETLKEFSRLLKSGGTLFLTAPFCSIPHMEPYYYYTGFSKDFYIYFAQKYGFDIVSIEPNGNAFDFVAQELIRTSQFIENTLLKIPYKILVYGVMLPSLKFLSKRDNFTNKYLCFGYHVKLIKK